MLYLDLLGTIAEVGAKSDAFVNICNNNKKRSRRIDTKMVSVYWKGRRSGYKGLARSWNR